MGIEAAGPLGESRKRVLIVDDHPLVRRGLADTIVHDPALEVCGEAGGFREALEQIASLRPDLVMIDLTLKEGDGLELVKRIHAGYEHVKMLVVSVHDEKLFAERALHAGASGYISKEATGKAFAEAIHRVLGGKVYLSPAMTERVLHRSLGHPSVELGCRPIERLTGREIEVFRLIGKGFTTRRIAQHLGLSTKTIETHRDSIKYKLHLETGSELNRQAIAWSLQQKHQADGCEA